MMVAGAALGAGLTKLNATEKTKMEERLMVQRLRNQSILPRASGPPLKPRVVAQLPPTTPQAQGSCRLCRRAASLSRAVLGGEAELGARACECAVTAGGAGAGDAGGDDDY
eukprot:COSAG02_NODE_2353_length_9081_cov_4.981073_5_plen_111_part_00